MTPSPPDRPPAAARPAPDPPAGSVPPSPDSRTDLAGPVRLLLIDDDEDDYLLTRDVVNDMPAGRYTLDWRPDYASGLSAVRAGGHDVYLVDYRIGAKTGVDLLTATRDVPGRGPMILLTGQGEFAIDQAAMRAGAADYLEKRRLDPTLLERSTRYALRQHRTEHELEQKVADRTASLAAANAKLQEADRRKDEFLATLGHELRNPLAPVRNALEIMRLAGYTPQAAQAGHAMMDRQIRHMVRLIDDLLDVSRITRGKLKLTREPADLRDILTDAVETARPLVEKAGLAFHAAVPPDPIPVSGDRVRLGQVFINILTNAAKYTEPDGTVTLAVARTEAAVEVTVADTGLGIPPELLPQIFDLFTQIDRTLNRAQGGLGIGLALVKQLVDLHGGTVTAASPGAGCGATFTVRLPLRGAEAGEEGE